MRIDVYVHSDAGDSVLSALTGIKSQLASMQQQLATIQQEEVQIMASIQDVQNAVTQEDTVVDSAIALLNGLSAQIAALKTTQTDPATAVAIDALNADITAKSDSLAAAVAANTVASSETPPSP